MMRRPGTTAGWLLAIALTLGGIRAGAQPTPSDRALATQLFLEGRALMDQKQYAEACPKLEESQRLDPGGGTLLNLALCHDKLGRTATAWSEYSEAVSVARRDRRMDREKLASASMKALEPRLSRLTIKVDPASAIEGLVIKRDGTEVGKAAWDTAMPVDPGSHLVEASAPGYIPWAISVEIGDNADQQTVGVPALLAAPPAAPPAPEPSTPKPIVQAPARARATPAPEPDVQTEPASRTPALVALGVGIVAAGAGTYFGLRALDKRRDSDAACEPRCTERAVELNDQAGAAADLATLSFAVSAVGLGLGTYWWLSASATAPDTPSRGASSTLTLSGRW